MPITTRQIQDRTRYLGSSDMPAVLGIDPWRSAHDVWLEKTGRVTPVEETSAMEAGTIFETSLLHFAERELGKIKRNQYRICPGFPLAAHIDAIVVQSKVPVEAKLSLAHTHETWGEFGTDDIPDRVIVQAHVHMMCLRHKPTICYVPHFHPFQGFGMYVVPRHGKIVNAIQIASEDFWLQYVEKDVAPPVNPTLPAARRIIRKPNTTTLFTQINIVEEWLKAKEALKEVQAYKDEMEAAILGVLGTAEGSELIPDLGGTLTYLPYTRRNVDVTKLKVEYPSVYDDCAKPSEYRVLRLKPFKPGEHNKGPKVSKLVKQAMTETL